MLSASHNRSRETKMDIYEFCAAVGAAVKSQHGLNDGADLAHTMIIRGDIKITDDVNRAARKVAQLLEQQ